MKFEFSAGGVVSKKEGTKVLILVAKHFGHHSWVFPKGLIGDHPSASSGQAETKEEAALREVKEETGINAKIIKPLTPIEYWYNWEGQKIKKTVYYFIMEFISGDTKDHDWEMEEVEWIPEAEVEKRLSYPSDKEVWSEAKKELLTIDQ